MNFINKIRKIKVETLLKIIPFVFLLHELEEWNTLAWHQKHQVNVPDVIDADLRTIFILLIIFAFTVVYGSLLLKNRKVTAYILFPLLSFLLYNGVVHFYWTILFKSYSPGLIFGFFIGVPLTSIVLYRMVTQGLVKKRYALVSFLIIFFLFIHVVQLGSELEAGIANLMILGKRINECTLY